MERFNDDLLLTTSQVAGLLDVHPSTVKRWCDAGDLPSEKTEGGHRRIHVEDAVAAGRARDIPTYLAPFAPYEAHVWSAVQDILERGSYRGVHTLAMGWLRRGHAHRVGMLFRALARHPAVEFTSLCDEGVRGFMARVGEAWRSGRLRVAEEHLATQTVIEALLRSAPPRGGEPTGEDGSRRAPVALVGAMEGDQHHLGALCVRLLLEREGWAVYYLGPDVPLEDFAAMQRSVGASLVCVSFSPPHTGADVLRCVRVLQGFYDPERGYALALGGSLGEAPPLDAASLPFRFVDLFESCAAFQAALHDGLGRRATAGAA